MTEVRTQLPIPVARLIEQVCDDGTDYDDGVMGYCSGRYEEETGVLTLRFEREEEDEADEGDDWASAEYRFHVDTGPSPSTGLDFSAALQAVKDGHRVQRAGWNGKGMWVGLVELPPVIVGMAPFLALKAADGSWAPWVTSQTDVLAEDWEILADGGVGDE